MLNKTLFFISALILCSATLFAQAAETTAASPFEITAEYIPYILLTALIVAIGVIIALALWVVTLLDYIKKEILKEKDIEPEEEEEKEDVISKFFSKIERQLTDAVPVEREKEIEFAHEYDGIRELDNNLPPWWKYMFYLTIVFAVVYLFYYHAGNGALSAEEYKHEMAEAALQKEEYLKKAANLVDESSVEALTDDASVSKGKQTFTKLCTPCHGEFAEGKPSLGPNLTDEYWLHGGGIKNVFKTIKYGVTTKGMISWQTQLNPRQIQEVASYVLSLEGSNPPNPKEPQGEKWIPEAQVETAL